MRKVWKRGLCAVLSLLTLCVLLPHAAAAEAIDPERAGSLTIQAEREGQAIPGMGFAIYYAASVDPYGEYTLAGDFREDNVVLDDQNWSAVARTLANIAQRDGRKPLDQGTTDENGRLTFPTGEGVRLTAGLYLVVASPRYHGSYTDRAEPYLVALPDLDREANCWVYDVTSLPKIGTTYTPPSPAAREVRVLKVWSDAGNEEKRPESITVQLLKDGAVYDTVTLSAENNWAHTWTGLPQSENGRPIDWQVAESAVPGYTVAITEEGVTFRVENTYQPEEPDNPDNPDIPDEPPPLGPGDQPGEPTLPQTGALWWPVPLLAAAGLLLLTAGLLLRRREDA